MAGEDTDKTQAQVSGNMPGPDVMLGLWASWMDQMSTSVQASADKASVVVGDDGRQPCFRTPRRCGQAVPGESVEGSDAALHRSDVERQSLARGRPGRLGRNRPGVAHGLAALARESPGRPRPWWTSTRTCGARRSQIWQEAGQRWLGLADASRRTNGQSARSPDKRFAAPEWHTNPAYRTLKEVYLLASDWLLKQSDADDDLDEAERQRINFHLRQFVDAMSPTLMLMSNPAALHKAIETGGASVVAGARNLMTDLNAGRLTMVDAEAFAPGRNLALTPGKVVSPQSPDRADPVRAHNGAGSQDPAADPAALDQQVLHPRHATEEQHGAVPG